MIDHTLGNAQRTGGETMTENNEARLCPCCGGDVQITMADGLQMTQMPAFATVVCRFCGLRLTRYGYTSGQARQAALDDWNRRI